MIISCLSMSRSLSRVWQTLVADCMKPFRPSRSKAQCAPPLWKTSGRTTTWTWPISVNLLYSSCDFCPGPVHSKLNTVSQAYTKLTHPLISHIFIRASLWQLNLEPNPTKTASLISFCVWIRQSHDLVLLSAEEFRRLLWLWSNSDDSM